MLGSPWLPAFPFWCHYKQLGSGLTDPSKGPGGFICPPIQPLPRGGGGERGELLLFPPFTAKKTQAPGSRGLESSRWLVAELRFTHDPLRRSMVRRTVRNAVCRKVEGKMENLASPPLLDRSWPLMPLSQQLGFPKVVEIRNEDGP